MALIDRINAVVTAIGLDIKALYAQVALLSGGGVPTTVVTVNVTPAKYFECATNVVDASVSASSIIAARLVPNDDFEADDLSDFVLQATPLLGSIDFLIVRNGPIVGDFKIAYQVLS